MSGYIEWGALANVVVLGILVGAGLPALFAVGVRALAGPGSHDEAGGRSVIRVIAAVACFAVVIGAIAYAIVLIRAGHH